MLYRRHALSFPFMTLVLLACSSCGVKTSQLSTAPPSNASSPKATAQINTYPPLRDDGSAIRFVNYGIGEGLSQSSAQVIFQDNSGFLWIGTQDGLNRFDGYSFKVFRPNSNDPNSLSGRDISSIAQGKDGMIWIGTTQGLNRYDPSTGIFTHFLHDDKNPESLANNGVQALWIDTQGMIWIGTAGGVDELDPATGKFNHLSIPTGSSTSSTTYSVMALYEDNHGMLWIGTNQGLFGFSTTSQKYQIYQTDNSNGTGITFNEITSVQGDNHGNLWVGTSHGLIQLDPATGQITLFSHSDLDTASLIDNGVMSTYIDRAGELWVGTKNGLDRFDMQDQHFIHYQNDPADPTSLSDNTVDAIYEDRSGILWFGTLAGGLDKYDRSQDQFEYYHHINADPHSLSGDIIFPIFPLPNGKLWIGSYHEGMNLFDPRTGQSEHFQHDPTNPNSLLSNFVISTFVDKQGTLWVGTGQGMDRRDAGSSNFIHYVFNPQAPDTSIPTGAIHVIFQDNQSTYWIGTSYGVRIFDPLTGRFSKFTNAIGNVSGLADGIVWAIYQDHSGMIWFGTEANGLFRFNPTTRKLDQFKDNPGVRNGPPDAPVLDIYEDKQDRIWMATFGGGLFQFNPANNTFIQYSENNGLPNDVIYGVLEDKDGYLWMSTNLGISRFDPSTDNFVNFTVEDGLQSNEFDSSAFAIGEDGRMYFGGVNGLTVFDPTQIHKNQYIPPIALTSLTTVNGKPVDPSRTAAALQAVTLPYPQSSFDFSFAALSFSKTDRNQYQYELEGFEKQWHTSGTDRRGSYTNLPGGTYVLHVIGSNSDGVWNEQGTTVRITVIPLPWQTWPFRGLMAAAFIVMVALAYQWRMRGINAQKVELERIVHDRTLALKRQNQGLEALYWADDKMLRIFTVDQVMQTLVDVAVDILQADKSAVFVQSLPHGEYLAHVSRGFHAETIASLHLAQNDEIVALVVSGSKPLVINDVNDSRWKKQRAEVVERMRVENVHSLMYMPIMVQNEALGIFNVCSSKLDAFDEGRQRLFAFLVQRAALSIENSQLVQQTKQMAVRDERNRLAQELHDNAKQKAFAALAHLGTAKRLASTVGNHIDEHLAEAENILSDVIRDLTFLIQELYPKELKEKGLIPSLRNYISEWESRSGIRIDLSVIGERNLPFEIEQVLYRVVLEGLSNIARHSRATQADVQVTYGDHEIAIEIRDNGQGFDVENTAGGLGLRLIRERMESIGGQAEIQSRPGGGVQFFIRAPVEIKGQ